MTERIVVPCPEWVKDLVKRIDRGVIRVPELMLEIPENLANSLREKVNQWKQSDPEPW